jgi:hypothetical protein
VIGCPARRAIGPFELPEHYAQPGGLGRRLLSEC